MNQEKPVDSGYCFRSLLLALALGLVLGYVWNLGAGRGLFALIAFPILCFYFDLRLQVLSFCLGFFLIFTWFLPIDYAHFFDPINYYYGFLFYGLTLAILITPWVLFYPPKTWSLPGRLLFISIAILLVLLPPVAVLMPANFLVSMGYLFPGLSWLGFGLFFGLLYLLLIITEKKYRTKKVYAAVLLLFMVSLYANLVYKAPQAPLRWAALDTAIPRDIYELSPKRFEIIASRAKERINQGDQLIVLPETALGVFGNNAKARWDLFLKPFKDRHGVLIGGAEVLVAENKWDDGFLILSAKETKFIASRQKMPFIAWAPWRSESPSAAWFKQNNFQLLDQNIQVSVCYEDFIPWLQLWPFAQRQRPTIMVTINNLNFAGYRLRMLQHKTVYGFARLFAVPLLEATNYSSVIKKT